MAEAVIEDRPQQPQKRFYCHSCSREIENLTNEFMCPHCSRGFVEEIPATSDNNSAADVEMLEHDTITNDTYAAYADLNNRLTDELSTLFMSVADNRSPLDDEENAQISSGSSGNGSGGRRRGVRRRLGVGHLNNFDNVLHDLLISVTSGAGGVSGGGTPMFFMGNPGDYAWGREGLDTIVTQLLNQMDSTGPPPLPKDQIQQIPKVEISQDQVDIKLQCSVCWEDFQLDENVRQLTCSHIYHENCIVPWLELHGTCPVCRKSFVPEYTEEHQRNSIRNVAAFMRSETTDPSTSSTNTDNPSSSHVNNQLLLNAIMQQHHQQQQPPPPPPHNNSTSTQQQNNSNSSNNRRNNSDRDSDGIVDFDFD